METGGEAIRGSRSLSRYFYKSQGRSRDDRCGALRNFSRRTFGSSSPLLKGKETTLISKGHIFKGLEVSNTMQLSDVGFCYNQLGRRI